MQGLRVSMRAHGPQDNVHETKVEAAARGLCHNLPAICDTQPAMLNYVQNHCKT